MPLPLLRWVTRLLPWRCTVGYVVLQRDEDDFLHAVSSRRCFPLSLSFRVELDQYTFDDKQNTADFRRSDQKHPNANFAYFCRHLLKCVNFISSLMTGLTPVTLLRPVPSPADKRRGGVGQMVSSTSGPESHRCTAWPAGWSCHRQRKAVSGNVFMLPQEAQPMYSAACF